MLIRKVYTGYGYALYWKYKPLSEKEAVTVKANRDLLVQKKAKMEAEIYMITTHINELDSQRRVLETQLRDTQSELQTAEGRLEATQNQQ